MTINTEGVSFPEGIILGLAQDVVLNSDEDGQVTVNGKPLSSGAESIASAAELPLPDARVVTVTGTTNITSIAAGGVAGQVVTLIFAGILTFTDGSNLKLAGNLVTTADDTITLVCDGTNWFEAARSVN
jgi:hypothetical protein